MSAPLKKRGPLGTVFSCPFCGHSRLGLKSVRFDCTRAHAAVRSHIARCKRAR